MPSRQERSEKTARDMFLEQAAAYFDDLKTTTKSVPTQKAFDTAEAFCLDKGRELIRQSLEAIIQEQIDDHEKKRNETLSAMPTEKTAPGLPKQRTNKRPRHRQT
jgi:hypothetical protein